VFGLQERYRSPEAEVKTVLRTEVHAQIFAGLSLQRPYGVINGLIPRRLNGAVTVHARGTMHGMAVA
jgi:hypothetical protein